MNKKNILLILGILVLALISIVLLKQKSKPILETKEFGFIRKVEFKNNIYLISFDEAKWLIGEEAEKAAARTGICETEIPCLPNGYFIENSTTSTREIELARKAKIYMETYETGMPGDKEEIISVEKFAELINDPTFHFKLLPYYLIFENNRLIRIMEQYVP